jgi:hypothetical protein
MKNVKLRLDIIHERSRFCDKNKISEEKLAEY